MTQGFEAAWSGCATYEVASTRLSPRALLTLGPGHSPWGAVPGTFSPQPHPVNARGTPHSCDNHRYPTSPWEAVPPANSEGVRWHLPPTRRMEEKGEESPPEGACEHPVSHPEWAAGSQVNWTLLRPCGETIRTQTTMTVANPACASP